MVKFGPSGESDSIIAKKITKENLAKILNENELSAFEFSFTNGVSLSSERAKKLNEIYKTQNIEISVHAPYYINLANPNELNIDKSYSYLLQSIERANDLGAKRIVFHPGSLTKQTREIALKNILKNLRNFIDILKQENLYGILLCPETMGKHGQCGTVEEVAEMCKVDECIIPTLDFGHINSFTLGQLTSVKKYKEILDLFVNKLNRKEIHIHFSRIEFGNKGELKHLNFSDESDFGPDYKQMLKAVNEILNECKEQNREVKIIIISESRGQQLEDSIAMQKYYKNAFIF